MKKILLLSFLLSAVFAQAQVGFGTATPDQSSEIEIQSTNKGMLVPRIGLTSGTQKLQENIDNANSLLIFNNGTALPTGFYYWKANVVNGTDNGTWIAVGSEVSSMPKFFYMPSVVLPTTLAQSQTINPAYLGVGDTTNPQFVNKYGMEYNQSTKVFTINLYNIFSAQFTSPFKTSSSATGLSGFVLNSNHYEYYITKVDTTVFEDVTLSDDGVLTYKVIENAVARDGSYMNIVLKAK